MSMLFSKQKFIYILFIWSSLSISYMSATDWLGGTQTCTESNIDTSFTIANANIIQGPIFIQSNAVDVTVTVGANASLQSDNTVAGRLFISANTGRTVTFAVNNDLLFRGSNNNVNPLLISFSGSGTLVFDLADGTSVSFTSTPTSEGARFYLDMNSDNPTVIVQRQNNNSVANVEFHVGPKSLVTYVARGSQSASGSGTIQFNPNNTNADGLMILRLEDASSFVITGNRVAMNPESCDSIDFCGFTVADVDLTTLAGQAAIFNVLNSASAGSQNQGILRIINDNKILPPLRIDPFCNNAFYNANGVQHGFILGPNGQVTTQDRTYIDYITTSSNTCSTCVSDCACGVVNQAQFIKARNPSAFFVDGVAGGTPHAIIDMNGSSGIFFRAGANKCGEANELGNFVIDPGTVSFLDVKTAGAGDIVFDVEGLLDVTGDSPNSNALNVLSLQVDTTGCPIVIASEATSPSKVMFPARTFARNSLGDYLRYNSGAFLINNTMNIINASLVHDDNNHIVLERDNLNDLSIYSEPTYIGGETERIECNGSFGARPVIVLENSVVRFHTNAGFTGVDIQVPNIDTPQGNISVFRFYANGCTIDKTYGRYVILGTKLGSTSCNGAYVNGDTHLDIMQTTAQSLANMNAPQRLELQTSQNDSCYVENLPATIGLSVHTLYLGNASNISIGTNTMVNPAPSPATTPTLLINGEFISFETQGGRLQYPEASGTTGEGGIFVDTNGVLTITDFMRANFSTMAVKSGNGVINLPIKQVHFNDRVGITNWNIDLSDPAQQVVVGTNDDFSDFTLDWGAVQLDCANFVPYEPTQVVPGGCSCPGGCACVPVVPANLTSIPKIEGQVDQLQIKRSRIGDQVHLVVDGGLVRELVMLHGFNTAEAPVGFIAVNNFGELGLGTASRNPDSLDASVKLGINGIMLCAQGDGIVNLNENILVDNYCPILPGPDFGVSGPQTLTIHSEVPREFRIKKTGVLDLSKFNTPNMMIRFTGEVQFIMEPGSKIILGSATPTTRGTVIFGDNTEFRFSRVENPNLADKTSADALQPILATIAGTGNIVLANNARMRIYQQAFVAVQSDPICALQTDIQLILNHQGRLEIGSESQEGGSLQIGNTADQGVNSSVKFTLLIDGKDAVAEINRLGYLGAGAGIASKLPNTPPNDWSVQNLFNMNGFQITVVDGTFRHNQIYLGSDVHAGLFAIGGISGNVFGFEYFPDAAVVPAGGNLFLMPTLDRSPVKVNVKPNGKTKQSMRSKSIAHEDVVIPIKEDSMLPVDHFALLDENNEHIQDIHLRIESGAIITGADGQVELKLVSEASVDMYGPELIALSKCVRAIPEAEKITRKPKQAQKMIHVAPGSKIVLAPGVEIKNDGKKDLVISSDLVAQLTTLLGKQHAGKPQGTAHAPKCEGKCISAGHIIKNCMLCRRALAPVHPIVNDIVTANANIMQSKNQLDQFPLLFGQVSAANYFAYLSQIPVNSYKAPMVSVCPNTSTQSMVGYIGFNNQIVRKNLYRCLSSFSGDSSNHRGAHQLGAAHACLHATTGELYSVTELNKTVR